MRSRHPARFIVTASIAIGVLGAFRALPSPEGDFVGIVRAYLAMGSPAAWDGIEKLPNIKWAPLPPTALKNCLPDGGCFARQGAATVGDRSFTVAATGARTMVFTLYFRNTTAPLGEQAVVTALKQAGFAPELARCPVGTAAGGTNWYRLKGSGTTVAHLSIQPATVSRPAEGFVLTPGAELPPLQPTQVALYSEQCSAGGARTPVSTRKPHELLAQAIIGLLVPAGGATLYDWNALVALPTGMTWDSAGPKAVDLSYKQDPNPRSLGGVVTFAGRKFSLLASGTPSQVKVVYLEEMGMHPRGEHMLGVVYEKGIAVGLVRCGPPYSESTNNWYGLTSTKTRPAMVRQSIRYDGNQVQDSYELRLDGTLPARDPRDRNPGASGC